MDPFLTIIIPSYNRAEKLEACLSHLIGQNLNAESYEILVVNDGSTDETQAVLEKWREKKQIHVFTQKNQGQGVARNLAIKNARGFITLFMGDDIYAAPNFLIKHVEFHKENPEPNKACLGLTEWDPNHEITPFMDWMVSGGYQFSYHKLTPNQEASFWFFYTSNLSIKTELLKQNLFDTDFKSYGWEDTELGYRLMKKHQLKLIFKPEALAYHDHFLEEGSLKSKMQSLVKNGKIFEAKHPELQVLPQGVKKNILQMLSSSPMRALLKGISPFSSRVQRAYWYVLAKHYFLSQI